MFPVLWTHLNRIYLIVLFFSIKWKFFCSCFLAGNILRYSHTHTHTHTPVMVWVPMTPGLMAIDEDTHAGPPQCASAENTLLRLLGRRKQLLKDLSPCLKGSILLMLKISGHEVNFWSDDSLGPEGLEGGGAREPCRSAVILEKRGDEDNIAWGSAFLTVYLLMLYSWANLTSTFTCHWIRQNFVFLDRL